MDLVTILSKTVGVNCCKYNSDWDCRSEFQLCVCVCGLITFIHVYIYIYTAQAELEEANKALEQATHTNFVSRSKQFTMSQSCVLMNLLIFDFWLSIQYIDSIYWYFILSLVWTDNSSLRCPRQCQPRAFHSTSSWSAIEEQDILKRFRCEGKI